MAGLVMQMIGLINTGQPLSAQDAPTATPLQVQIITSTPLPLIVSSPSPTFTPSPDVQSAVLLEAKISSGDVNARSEADLEAEIVGKIRAGDQYVVTGRYFRWLRFRYENRDAWVFDELVDILGDETLIPDLTQLPQETEDPTLVAASETNAVLVQTPGALLTATASSRELVGPVAVGENGASTSGDPDQTLTPEAPRTVLPTYTYPPAVAMGITGAPDEPVATAVPLSNLPLTSGQIPPVIPILLLAGFGLIGLTVSAIRSR